MAPLRLFVALELPPEVRDALAAVGAAADAEVWRAVKPETLHVTLAFLGYRAEQEAAAIVEAMNSAPTAAPLLVPGESWPTSAR